MKITKEDIKKYTTEAERKLLGITEAEKYTPADIGFAKEGAYDSSNPAKAGEIAARDELSDLERNLFDDAYTDLESRREDTSPDEMAQESMNLILSLKENIVKLANGKEVFSGDLDGEYSGHHTPQAWETFYTDVLKKLANTLYENFNL